MIKEQEVNQEVEFVSEAIDRKDVPSLLGSIAMSLFRLANAQEAVYELAVKDLNEQIEGEIQRRAEALAENIDKEKTSRSFIGKR